MSQKGWIMNAPFGAEARDRGGLSRRRSAVSSSVRAERLWL